jgi:ABC-2 type transport system ATP-binding protein
MKESHIGSHIRPPGAPGVTAAAAVDIRGLRKSFGAAFALGPLSLEVPRGTIWALVGPNGAGKTTLLNLLMGIGRADGGDAQLLGRDVSSEDVEIKRRTAFVSPDLSYRVWGTVGRAIDFVSAFYPDWGQQRCEELLLRFGLQRSERIEALSFGGRVKLSAVMALARSPELLLLDEPTIGLDPLARQLLFTELLRFMQSEERTIVISSNQLNELERLADHIAILNAGQILASGATPDLLERYVQLDVLLKHGHLPALQGFKLLARDGDRARLLTDREALASGALSSSNLEVIEERTLTLEELFVGLVKGGTASLRPSRMVVA